MCICLSRAGLSNRSHARCSTPVKTDNVNQSLLSGEELGVVVKAEALVEMG